MQRKPVWTEGLFVSQHHFQAQDRYHEDLLRQRFAGLSPFLWGISGLAVDQRLLSTGQLGLQRLIAVWPDGLIVRCSGDADGDPLPAPRAFEAHLAPGGAPLDVFVGVPLEGASNVALGGEVAAAQRFGSVSQSTEDFNGGGAAQSLDFAVPNVHIVFGGERRDRLTTIRIAQLLRQADGTVVVRDTFVPPVLQIGASPFLTGGLRRVLGAMIARQRVLSAQRKQRSAASVEVHASDARRFWLLHTLSGAIPVLSHFLENEGTHPEPVYLALARLTGELSTFAPDADAFVIPKFDFLRLGEVFEPLFARVLALLTVDAAPAYVEIPLQKRADGMFVGRLPEPQLARSEFFVTVRSPLPEAEARERVPQLLKVADWGKIVEVVKQARHGVRVEIEWNPSSVLPLRPGLAFFRLRREGPFWEEIARTSTLALCLPNDAVWRETGIQVYAVDPAHLR